MVTEWHNTLHGDKNNRFIILVSGNWELGRSHPLHTSDEDKAKQIAEIFGCHSDWEILELQDGAENILSRCGNVWFLNGASLQTNSLSKAKAKADLILNPIVWKRWYESCVFFTEYKAKQYMLRNISPSRYTLSTEKLDVEYSFSCTFVEGAKAAASEWILTQ